MKKIIGIAGFKRSGKDTSANYFKEKHNYQILSFAGPIKSMIYTMVDSLPAEDYIEVMKELPIPRIGVSYRKLAYTLGTAWGRDTISPDIWIKLLQIKMEDNNFSNVVIPDVRFENEVEWIKSNGGIIIKINRDTGLVSNHVSELGIDDKFVDYIFENNGTIEELYQQLATVDLND